MKYIKLVIAVKDEYQESLIAELMDMEFNGFEQRDDELITYITKEHFHVGDRERMERLLASYPGNGHIRSEEVVADQNWNEEWEKTIQAQEIGPFLVKPTWSRATPKEGQILLEIDPKMAFGTGYHETTRLMLIQLPEVIEQGAEVLDAGTGTGILAIAAVKLGAKSVFAFDIDQWSITNAQENIYLNKVADSITIKKGGIEVLKNGKTYDVILANIERNAIIEMLPAFSDQLSEGQNLLLSGLLKTDEELVLEKLKNNNLSHRKTVYENEWIAIWAIKETI